MFLIDEIVSKPKLFSSVFLFGVEAMNPILQKIIYISMQCLLHPGCSKHSFIGNFRKFRRLIRIFLRKNYLTFMEVSMKKTYVIDTNVLIQSPYALLSFEDNQVVLPIAVLEELDKLKNDEGERGANARQSIRYLEQLRQTGSLFEGVPTYNNGIIRIEANFVSVTLPHGFTPNPMITVS